MNHDWYVEIELRPRRSDRAIELDLAIYGNEWGLVFRCDDKLSALRVTDEPFVHGRDDYNLLRELTTLDRIGVLVQALEDRHGIELDLVHARIRSNLGNAHAAVRRW